MKKNNMKPDLDVSYVNIVYGDVEAISGGDDKDYTSKINMILPIEYKDLPRGDYNINYKDYIVNIRLEIVNDREDDPVYKFAKDMMDKRQKHSSFFSTDGEFDSLPFDAFMDNKGKYPVVMATIIFPIRLASWRDANHPTGRKIHDDYEALQITGEPDSQEKIIALIILNRLIKTFKNNNFSSIFYDDITVFSERYFNKVSDAPLILRVNTLSTKDAYKNAIYDYFFKNYEKLSVDNTVRNFQKRYENKEILDEKNLKFVVEDVIENVLKHYIETRRLIEPFWDGQRIIKNNENKIKVPIKPKGETKIQPTLHFMLEYVLSTLGIHVIRESDEGIGSLDFKFLFTTKDKLLLSVGVEFKLAHQKVEDGITKQLPAYLKAIRSTSGIFVVMWFKDAKFFTEPNKYTKEILEEYILKQAQNVSTESKIKISAIMIDASIRPSASNL